LRKDAAADAPLYISQRVDPVHVATDCSPSPRGCNVRDSKRARAPRARLLNDSRARLTTGCGRYALEAVRSNPARSKRVRDPRASIHDMEGKRRSCASSACKVDVYEGRDLRKASAATRVETPGVAGANPLRWTRRCAPIATSPTSHARERYAGGTIVEGCALE
jgi:hypothetical protein